jgi:polysaccharide export outer membrane protein
VIGTARILLGTVVALAASFAGGTVLAQAPETDAVSEYEIGAEDVLLVQVPGRPDLSGSVPVDVVGMAQLPLLGSVEVEGNTTAEFGKILWEEYRLLDPKITDVLVSVAQYNSRRVTVVGEVRNPGSLGFPEIPDLWTVLLKAGGVTPLADLARVQVVREEGDEDGPRTVDIDLSRGIDKIPSEDLPELRAQDTIVVPSLAEQATSGDRLYVLGAVRAPGTIRIGVAETLIEALSATGGPLSNANLREVHLTRPGVGGALSYRLNLEGYLFDGRPAADLRLQPGDTILVPERASLFQSVLGVFFRVVPLVTTVTSLIITLN